MKLNSIWWWGFNSWNLENVEYFFIAMILSWISSINWVPSVGHVDRFENYTYKCGYENVYSSVFIKFFLNVFLRKIIGERL